jgi:23S rRNA-/tRNA-specific pseudouridylate synthase
LVQNFKYNFIFKKSEKNTAKKLHSLFSERRVIKQYLAITRNIPKIKEGEINIPLIRRKVNDIEKTFLSPDFNDENKEILNPDPKSVDTRKSAITKYRVLDSANLSSLIELQPLTGI